MDQRQLFITVWIMRVAFSLQCLGYGILGMKSGTSLGSFLFLNLDFSDTASTQIDKILCLTLCILGAVSLVKHKWWIYAFAGFWVAACSTISFFFAGKFYRELSIVAASSRIALPFLLMFYPQLIKHGKSRFIFLLKCAISLTFFTHGIEALLHNPIFVDYVIVAGDKLLGLHLHQSSVEIILTFIGIADVVLAVFCIATSMPNIFLYMSFWGAVTSFARIIYQPNLLGVCEMILRSSHVVIPLAIVLLGSQTSKIMSGMAAMKRSVS